MDKFRLSWNDHHSMLQTVFARLLVAEQFVDVTLSCEGRNIRCHRVVLSACSSYFEGLLTTNQCPHPIVVMRDVTFEEMSDLVNFMYFGEVTVEEKKLTSLLRTAEFLEIKGLGSNIPPEVSSTKDGRMSSQETAKKRQSSVVRHSELQQVEQQLEESSDNDDPTYSPTLPAKKVKKSANHDMSRDDTFDLSGSWSVDAVATGVKVTRPRMRLENPIPANIIHEGKITYLEHEGMRFRIKSKYGGGKYWNCVYRGCSARVTTNSDGQICSVKGEHIHVGTYQKKRTLKKVTAQVPGITTGNAGEVEKEHLNDGIVFTIGEPEEVITPD